MPDVLMQTTGWILAAGLMDAVAAIKPYALIFLGFSAVIFVHELGHFLVAKWADVRIDKFCIGFGRELFGFTRGETRYGFNILPLGGYVKMLGQEDFEVDASGEYQAKQDPRSFANKSVGRRALIVSAGVIMNVVFAAFLFMIVFMIGMDATVTEVGFTVPNSPAAIGGLLPGDKIVEIDGRKVKEFNEVRMAIVLADPHEPLDFKVVRDGQEKHVQLVPEAGEDQKILQAGMGPASTRTIVIGPPGADPERHDLPRPGDKLVEIDGQPVTDENANEMFFGMFNDLGRLPEVWVERPIEPDQEDTEHRRMRIAVSPALKLNPSDLGDRDSVNILGFAPLMRFDSMMPGGRAELAGIREGDTIIQVEDVRYPTGKQIGKAVHEACKVVTGTGEKDFDFTERDIRMVVQRSMDRREVSVVVRPKVKQRLLSQNGRPRIEASYQLIADDLLRVGGIIPDVGGTPTPAAQSGIPTGSLLTRVNDVAVNTWVELIEQARRQAGETVEIGYVGPNGQAATAAMFVPPTLRTKLGLPVTAQILAVDGEEGVTADYKDRKRRFSVAHWFGLRSKLAQCVGQTVEVRYSIGLFGEAQTTDVEVTEDMIDPWLGRIEYYPNFLTAQARTRLKTSNPLEAIAIGVKKTYYFVMQVYTTMERMIFTRSVGVEQISGPVGIVQAGRNVADAGMVQLLFFLAIISANLAVINFLPLPIVDGGLMVFLIIEKIKGSPVSIKTQVVTQVIGLFLIIAAFVYVTVQDLQRIFG